MKRLLAILAAASLAATIGAGSVLAAKPVPAYTSTLVVNADCSFTLTATWPRKVAIDQVIAFWYQDDVYTFTMQAPFETQPYTTFNARKMTATFNAGPATPGPTHNWNVLTQFYSGGAHIIEMYSNTVTTNCGV